MPRQKFRNDLKTQLEKIQLDFRRQYLNLPRYLLFEEFDQATRGWREIGKVGDGWCADEVLAETSGGMNEYAVSLTWREGIDDLLRRCTAVRFGEVRLEKRAVDPANSSPAVLRLRGQIISGMSSEVTR